MINNDLWLTKIEDRIAILYLWTKRHDLFIIPAILIMDRIHKTDINLVINIQEELLDQSYLKRPQIKTER